MMSSISKAGNVVSVLLNKEAVKGVGIGVNKEKKPTQIAAILKDKNETEIIMKMFQDGFGCNFGCPSIAGIKADKEKGVVTIDRDEVHDKEAFDLVLGTLITAAELASK